MIFCFFGFFRNAQSYRYNFELNNNVYISILLQLEMKIHQMMKLRKK
jgi:hypothetical protein